MRGGPQQDADRCDMIEAIADRLRSQFDLKSSADYVYDIKSRDLDISKESGRIIISVVYQKTVPLLYNVSLLFDFEASNRK